MRLIPAVMVAAAAWAAGCGNDDAGKDDGSGGNGNLGADSNSDSDVCRPITVLPPSTTTLMAGTPYEGGFATNARAPRFEVLLGALPAGLTLAPDGSISGTPAQVGDATFRVAVHDAIGCLNLAPSVTMHVACPDVAIAAPAALPDAESAVPYAPVQLAAAHVGADATWTVAKGKLPNCLHLGSNGTIEGVPSADVTGQYFTVRVESRGCSASVDLAIRACGIYDEDKRPGGAFGNGPWDPVSYFTPDVGYLHGTNNNGQKAHANEYYYGAGTFTVDKVTVGLGNAATSDRTRALAVTIWNRDDPWPGEMLGSTPISLGKILDKLAEPGTGSWAYFTVTFSPPVNLPPSGWFFAGVDNSQLSYPQETISVVSNAMGQSSGHLDYAQGPAGWSTYPNANTSLFVFPHVCGIATPTPDQPMP
jgi:hypothetical protein